MKLVLQLKTLSLFTLFFLLTTLSQAQQYAAASIPDSLKEGANAVIRYNYRHFEILSPKESKTTVKCVITLLNDKTNENQLVFSYNQYSEITKLKAKVYDAKGKLVKEYGINDFKDIAAFDGVSLYNDNRLKRLEINHRYYPYTIEFECEKENDETMSYPRFKLGRFFRGQELSMVVLSIPEDMSFQYQLRNMELEPTISMHKGVKKYTWLAKNIVPLKRERYMPADNESLPFLIIVPNELHVKGYKGRIENWTTYGKFMYELNEGRDKISTKLSGKIKTLTAGAKSDREKIKILYKYLQENNRYVSVQLGIGGWQTFDAKYVEKNKYGDCKALSNFMMAMLKEIDVKSYVAFVESSRDRPVKIDPNLVFDPFNHVILYIPGEDVWLECTSKNTPFNYLGSSNAGRDALLLTETGGKLTKTPIMTIDENLVKNDVVISLLPSGAAKLENKEIFTGEKHERYRREIAQSDLEDWFHEDKDLPSFTIDKLDLSYEEEEPQAALTYTLQIPRYASKAGKRLFVPINCINTFSGNLPEDEDRLYPIQISLGSSYEDRIALQIPEGYEVESIPEKEIKLDTEFGSYVVNIQVENNQVTYERKLALKSIDLPATRYNELRDFYKAITKADKMKLVLVKKKT
ncbi:MAG: DUF3857 domain-containing protein [Saprospiraceae bacterium]